MQLAAAPPILYIRRQLIILDAHLYAFNARLQELPGLESSPDLDHR